MPGAVHRPIQLLAAAAAIAAAADISPGELSAYAAIALLALAMGIRNTMVRGFGGPNFATAVNLTLTALTSPAPLSIASGSDIAQRAAAFLAILPPASPTCGRGRSPPKTHQRNCIKFHAPGPES